MIQLEKSFRSFETEQIKQQLIKDISLYYLKQRKIIPSISEDKFFYNEITAKKKLHDIIDIIDIYKYQQTIKEAFELRRSKKNIKIDELIESLSLPKYHPDYYQIIEQVRQTFIFTHCIKSNDILIERYIYDSSIDNVKLNIQSYISSNKYFKFSNISYIRSALNFIVNHLDFQHEYNIYIRDHPIIVDRHRNQQDKLKNLNFFFNKKNIIETLIHYKRNKFNNDKQLLDIKNILSFNNKYKSLLLGYPGVQYYPFVIIQLIFNIMSNSLSKSFIITTVDTKLVDYEINEDQSILALPDNTNNTIHKTTSINNFNKPLKNITENMTNNIIVKNKINTISNNLQYHKDDSIDQRAKLVYNKNSKSMVNLIANKNTIKNINVPDNKIKFKNKYNSKPKTLFIENIDNNKFIDCANENAKFIPNYIRQIYSQRFVEHKIVETIRENIDNNNILIGTIVNDPLVFYTFNIFKRYFNKINFDIATGYYNNSNNYEMLLQSYKLKYNTLYLYTEQLLKNVDLYKYRYSHKINNKLFYLESFITVKHYTDVEFYCTYYNINWGTTTKNYQLKKIKSASVYDDIKYKIIKNGEYIDNKNNTKAFINIEKNIFNSDYITDIKFDINNTDCMFEKIIFVSYRKVLNDK